MKLMKLFALALAVLVVFGTPVLAQQLTPEQNFEIQKTRAVVPNGNTLSGAGVGAGLGAALTIIGAGYGFSKIGSAALESMARQPEVAGQIQTAMIIIGALLEGATFFALIVCILVAGNAKF